MAITSGDFQPLNSSTLYRHFHKFREPDALKWQQICIRTLHWYALQLDLGENVYILSNFKLFYLNFGSLISYARPVFDRFPKKTVVNFNFMVYGDVKTSKSNLCVLTCSQTTVELMYHSVTRFKLYRICISHAYGRNPLNLIEGKGENFSERQCYEGTRKSIRLQGQKLQEKIIVSDSDRSEELVVSDSSSLVSWDDASLKKRKNKEMKHGGFASEKLPIRRTVDSCKGSLKKVLNEKKRNFFDANWFGDEQNSLYAFPCTHPKGYYSLSRRILYRLKENNWIICEMIDAYISLLRDREDMMAKERNVLVPVFNFMPTHFVILGSRDMKTQGWSSECARKKFFSNYIDKGVGKPLKDADYIFFPAFVNENHWVLFVFSVPKWTVALFDPLHEDEPKGTLRRSYKTTFLIMEKVVPELIRTVALHRCQRYPPAIFIQERRPKQENGDDCGIFVMKYMDYMCHGINLEEEEWSYEDVLNFRYRIANELMNHKARKIPENVIVTRLSSIW